jgi:hypothetical protein
LDCEIGDDEGQIEGPMRGRPSFVEYRGIGRVTFRDVMLAMQGRNEKSA